MLRTLKVIEGNRHCLASSDKPTDKQMYKHRNSWNTHHIHFLLFGVSATSPSSVHLTSNAQRVNSEWMSDKVRDEISASLSRNALTSTGRDVLKNETELPGNSPCLTPPQQRGNKHMALQKNCPDSRHFLQLLYSLATPVLHVCHKTRDLGK